MQDLVNRLEKEPREEFKKEVEQKRNLLSAEFEVLDGLQRRAVTAPGELKEYEDDKINFDSLDDDVLGAPASQNSPIDENPSLTGEAAGRIVPERRPLHIPSTCLAQDHVLSKLELRHRKGQANRYVMALREVIAEKSFQFTHIIRPAPRKGVITRARNTILKLNHQIAFYSKVYRRCRAALIRLAADEDTLKTYRILTPQDVKASSAVVDPNSTGSSTISLSWIWQTSTAGESPAKLRECKETSFFYLYLIFIIYS